MEDEKRVNELLEIERKFKKTMERSKKYTQRRNVRLMLFKEKAELKGIKVSDKEIDDRIKLMEGKK